MNEKERLDKTLKDMFQVEREANQMLSEYFGREYMMRKESEPYLKELGYGLVWHYLEEKIHRMSQKVHAMKIFFHSHLPKNEEFVVNAIKKFPKHRRDDKNYSYLCDAFVDNTGLEVGVEGSIRNRRVKVKYINKQIELLNQRKSLVTL